LTLEQQSFRSGTRGLERWSGFRAVRFVAGVHVTPSVDVTTCCGFRYLATDTKVGFRGFRVITWISLIRQTDEQGHSKDFLMLV